MHLPSGVCRSARQSKLRRGGTPLGGGSSSRWLDTPGAGVRTRYTTTPPVSLPSGAWNMDYRGLQTHILRGFARNFQKIDLSGVSLGVWSWRSTPLEIGGGIPLEEKQKLRRGFVRVYGVLPRSGVLCCLSLGVLQHKDTDFSPHFNSKYLLFPEPGWT